MRKFTTILSLTTLCVAYGMEPEPPATTPIPQEPQIESTQEKNKPTPEEISIFMENYKDLLNEILMKVTVFDEFAYSDFEQLLKLITPFFNDPTLRNRILEDYTPFLQSIKTSVESQPNVPDILKENYVFALIVEALIREDQESITKAEETTKKIRTTYDNPQGFLEFGDIVQGFNEIIKGLLSFVKEYKDLLEEIIKKDAASDESAYAVGFEVDKLLKHIAPFIQDKQIRQYILEQYDLFLIEMKKIASNTDAFDAQKDNYIQALILESLIRGDQEGIKKAKETTQEIRKTYRNTQPFLGFDEIVQYFKGMIGWDNLSEFEPKKIDTYGNKFLEFSQLIFSDIPGSEKKREPIIPLEAAYEKIIYNQEGYLERLSNVDLEYMEEVKSSGKLHKGPSLSLDDQTPIGYNMYLPQGDIKAIFIHIYGGGGEEFFPGRLENFEYYLLNQGIAVITLNLVDLRELEVLQAEMPQELHDRIHASINKFFVSIKKDGNNFSPDLDLRDKPIYLYGPSFGGGRAVRHAELYPNTFDGYISHDGDLSAETVVKGALFSEIIESSTKEEAIKAREWLDSMTEDPISDEKISKIQNPILLLHNFDDNMVNVKVSLHWYQKALKIGKGDLVRLFITRRGNPRGYRKQYKGHFVPEDTEAFKSYAATIASFILDGPSKLPEISEWMNHQIELYANKNYRSADLEEMFISEAYRLYKYDQAKRYEESVTAAQKKPSISLKEEKKYQRRSDVALSAAIQQEREQKKAYLEKAWVTEYRPIYYALRYLEALKDSQKLASEIDRLKKQGLLTDGVIEKALKKQMAQFLAFLQETYGEESSFERLREAGLVQEYRSWIENIQNFDPNFIRYLLYSLYVANPNLVPEVPLEETQDEKGAKANLFEKIHEEERKLRAIWKGAVRELLPSQMKK